MMSVDCRHSLANPKTNVTKDGGVRGKAAQIFIDFHGSERLS
jgi:hypothetical protein